MIADWFAGGSAEAYLFAGAAAGGLLLSFARTYVSLVPLAVIALVGAITLNTSGTGNATSAPEASGAPYVSLGTTSGDGHLPKGISGSPR